MKKEKQLTQKQENFCLQYVLLGNASAAYRIAYDTSNMKPETVNNSAYKLLQNGDVAARIEEIKTETEKTLGLSKTRIINELIRVYERCLEPQPVMVWDWVEYEDPKTGKMKRRKDLVQKRNEDDELVWMFDSGGANSALEKIIKAMGYNAPEKKDITSNGESIKSIIID